MQAAQCAAVAGSGIRFKELSWKIRKTHSVHSAATARKSRASYCCCTLCSLHSDYFKQQHGKHQWHVLASATALQFTSSFSIDPISYKISSCKITVSVFLSLFRYIFRNFLHPCFSKNCSGIFQVAH